MTPEQIVAAIMRPLDFKWSTHNPTDKIAHGLASMYALGQDHDGVIAAAHTGSGTVKFWCDDMEQAEAWANEKERDRIAAALDVEKIAALVEALGPFKAMSAELFARNWNKDDVVIALDSPGDPHRLTFGYFLDLHTALTAFKVQP